MYFHHDTIEEIKSRMDIVSVVEDFSNKVKLKKAGSKYIGLSPFTEEKTPSFFVSPAKNIFKCFSSGKGGNAITFLMELNNWDYPRALQHLAEKYGIEVKHHTPTPEEKKELDEKAQLYKLNQAALNQWKQQLLEQPTYQVAQDHPANYEQVGRFCPWPRTSTFNYKTFPVYHELMVKRKYTEETILQFGIGYAPDSWSFLYQKIKESGQVKLAEKLGLIKEGKKRDAFRHRIIYPIYDHQDNLVGFTARALFEKQEGDKKNCYEFIDGQQFLTQAAPYKIAKTINSSESAIYIKDQVLYGLHLAKDAIRKADLAYVVEGANDVVSMHQGGAANTVGTLGTALSKSHLKLLSRYTKNICIAFDPDAAGNRAAYKAADLAIREGFGVTICLLPDDHDPDSFVRSFSDPERFLVRAMGSHTDHAVVQIAQMRKGEITDALIKEKISKELANLISYVDGDTIRDGLVKQISKLYDINPPVFRKMVADFEATTKKQQERKRIIAKKNEITKLSTDPVVYPFYEENYDKNEKFKGIDIKVVRIIELLKSFGYSRYKLDGAESYTFIKIEDSMIFQVSVSDILDRFEEYVWKEHDFESTGRYTDSEIVWEKILRNTRMYISPTVLDRVVSPNPIVINKDTKTSTFFYYRNGFVEINADGWQLHPYTEMEGGIWRDQSNDRDFKMLDYEKDMGGNKIMERKAGTFAHFVWRIAGEETDRFLSLCSIIGYALHDYYDYKLKAISITDSSLAAESDGRSGKTLLFKMLQYVRKVVDINGKEFKQDDPNKYTLVDIDTQIVAINDLINKGRNKFDFELAFNDITEGAMVKKLYMNPFRKFFKTFYLTNAPLEIHGGSMEDRIIEFELSQHFHKDYSPEDEYGIWFGRDYDAKEWQYYDNFMCFCSTLFHKNGIVEAKSINLQERKLRKETTLFFVTFMEECDKNLKDIGLPWKEFQSSYTSLSEEIPTTVTEHGLTEVKLDKNKWYERIKSKFTEADQKWFTINFFSKCLKLFAKYRYGINNPYEVRSNNISWFHFVEAKEVAK